jgi:hypothetical protein
MLVSGEKIQKWNDPACASVHRLRDSFAKNGEVSDSDWQRVVDEELSLIAEGLSGTVTTSFDFHFADGHVRAADGESFTSITNNGVKYLQDKAAKDPRFEFAYQRACYEKCEAEYAEKMASGEIAAQTMITISPYPEEAAQKYGDNFLVSLGYQPKRKLSLIRAIEKTETGIRMHSRTVEDSSLRQWNSVCGGAFSATTSDEMLSRQVFFDTAAIDTLNAIEIELCASKGFNKNNTWDFLLSQKEISNYYFEQLLELSKTDLQGEALKAELNTLRYNYWSAIRLRHDSNSYLMDEHPALVMERAGTEMQNRREVFSSCGMNVVPIKELSQSQMQKELFVDGVKACVSCPFCRKIVSARFNQSAGTIECLNKNCGAKVNSKGKRIDMKTIKKTKTFSDLLLDIFFSVAERR